MDDKARIVELEQQIVKLEERIAWLELENGELADTKHALMYGIERAQIMKNAAQVA